MESVESFSRKAFSGMAMTTVPIPSEEEFIA